MRFEIVNPVNEIEPTKVEKVVRLGLDLSLNGAVSLVVLDEDGDRYNTLLNISSNGEFRTVGGVEPDLGFELDDDGYIIVEGGN